MNDRVDFQTLRDDFKRCSKVEKRPVDNSKPTLSFRPASRKQEMFLKSQAGIVVFGGGAGSGKSYCVALKLLQCVSESTFKCLVIRKTFKQIKGAGGILDTIKNVHKSVYDMDYNGTDHVLRYSTGAEIHFRPMAMKKHTDDIQGQQYSMIVVDEAQQIDGESLIYCLSRLRSEWEGIHQLVMTCNPLPDTFVHELVKPNLDEDGTPIEEHCGSIKYMLTRGGDVMMFNTRDEATPFLLDGEEPQSVSFINACVYDNPVLLKRQPDYVSKLQAMTRVEKARLLDGNWNVREESSGYFNESWLNPLFPSDRGTFDKYLVRAWDLANTLPSEQNNNPDWTAGVLMGAKISYSKDDPYEVAVLDVVRDRKRFEGVKQFVLDVASRDGKGVTISLPLDPGGASHFTKQLSASLTQLGYKVVLARPKGSKVDRFSLFAQLSEAGYVYADTKASWYKCYVGELCGFDGSRNVKDDQVDATSDAYLFISTKIKQSTAIRGGGCIV